MLPPSTMVAALTLMMLATPPLTSMVATPMLMLPSCMELMGMLPPSTMVAALTLMLLSTPPLTSMMATPMLMLPSCMELMAMLPLLLWWLPLHLKCWLLLPWPPLC